MNPLPELTFQGLRAFLGEDSWAWIVYGKLAATKAADHNVVVTFQGGTLAILSETEVYFSRGLPAEAAEYADKIAEDNGLGEVFYRNGQMCLYPDGWAQGGEPFEGKVVKIHEPDDAGGGVRSPGSRGDPDVPGQGGP